MEDIDITTYHDHPGDDGKKKTGGSSNKTEADSEDSLRSSKFSSQPQKQQQQQQLSPTEYLQWARSLVGRDWEIYWNDEEDAASSSPSAEDKDDLEEEEEKDMQHSTKKAKVLYKDDFMDDPLADDNSDHQESGARADLGKDDDDWDPTVNYDDDYDEMGGEIEDFKEDTAHKADETKSMDDDDASEDNPDKDENTGVKTSDTRASKEVPMMVTRRSAPSVVAASAKHKMEIDDEKEDHSKPGDDDQEEVEDDSEGSVINDWYDGHVIEFMELESVVGSSSVSSPATTTANDVPNLVFKVLFVGDDEIYNVSLVPSKVRPSARAWVKRTVAILGSNDNDVASPSVPPRGSKLPPNKVRGKVISQSTLDAALPPDTRTVDDEECLRNIEEKVGISPRNASKSQPKTSSYWANVCQDELAESPSNLLFPTFDDLYRIRELRAHLQSQIYLRSKLSKIETVEGEAKFIDGVRNPSEPYCNALIQCCKDVDQACAWFEKVWKLMEFIFDRSQLQNESGRERPDHLSVDDLVKDYIELGQLSITNAASIDVYSAVLSNKRKQPISLSKDASTSRRTKRRRRPDNIVTTGSQTILADPLSTEYVDYLVESLLDENKTWYIQILATMLRTLSLIVVKPVVDWKSGVSVILGYYDGHPFNVCSATINRRCGEEEESTFVDTHGSQSGVIKDTNTKNDIECDGSNDEDSSDEKGDIFSCNQIESYLSSVDKHLVLSRFDLSSYRQQLQSKLEFAENTIAELNSAVLRLSEEIDSDVSKTDVILDSLENIERVWTANDSPIRNVHPLGKDPSASITHNELITAMHVRKWLIDAERAILIHERHSFLDRLLSKITTEQLPDLDSLPNVCKGPATLPFLIEKWDNAKQLIVDLSNKMRPFVDLATEIQTRIDESISQDSNIIELTKILEDDLSKLIGCPVVLPVQEMIATSLDIAMWKVKADSAITKAETSSLTFEDIHGVFVSMERVALGKGERRSNLIKDTFPDEKADRQIRDFAAKTLTDTCRSEIDVVSTIYNFSSSWKERADSILLALRSYGNECAIHSDSAPPKQKQPNVGRVDIKRIDDLLLEYTKCKVDFTSRVNILTKILVESNAWSENFHKTILGWDWQEGDCFEFLETQRVSRPKGVLMEPSRAVVDSLINLLLWHRKLRQVSKEMRDASNDNVDLSEGSIINAYPLLVDGTNALELYYGTITQTLKGSDILKPHQSNIVSLLDRMYNVRKSGRAVEEILQSNYLLSSVFSSMIAHDEKYDKPLAVLSWLHWNALVADFVAPWSQSTKKDIPPSSGHIPTLIDAKKLQESRPLIDFSGETNESNLLDELIKKAERCEDVAKICLAQKKEIIRVASAKPDRALEHLSTLRKCLDEVKLRASGYHEIGIAVHPDLESRLTKHIAVFAWLERALFFPILFLDEVSFSSLPVKGREETRRIPFEVLCTLYERMPSHNGDESGSAYALACIRVKDLFVAASTWSEEVTRLTMISNRGSKRRQQTLSSTPEFQENEDVVELLQKDKMELLAQNPVIAKVIMPREYAVENMVKHSQEFEKNLHAFLMQDYSGMDKMAYPTDSSLLGKDSEFTLFRLTRNPMFFTMKEAMENLAHIANDVFAETKGKAAFDWIKTAVDWICSLEKAVCRDSPFPDPKRLLVIPAKRGKELYDEAEQIFLQPPSDAVQILSAHGIFLSTSSQRKDFNITVKKDGAHHSVGSVVMMWCPILFSALRNDLKRIVAWEEFAINLVTEFNRFLTTIDQDDPSADVSFKFYAFGCQARGALEEGHSSLVVVPTSATVNTLINIWQRGEEKSIPDLSSKFAQEFFTQSAYLYPNRFLYLDSLLHRRALWKHVDNRIEVEESKTKNCDELPFTEVFKASLETVFLRATTELFLEGSDYQDLCIVRAVEIASELFEKYGNNKAEYGAKARSLRSNLQNNIELCVSVICGDISAPVLVKMTPEQLASEKAKTARLAAKEAAMKDAVLTRGMSLNDESGVKFNKPSPITHNPPPPTAKPASGSILKSKYVPSPPPASDVKAGTGMLSSYHDSDSDYDEADGAPTLDEDDLPLASHTSTSGIASGRRKPPPPPSLASTQTFSAESSSPPPTQYDSQDEDANGYNLQSSHPHHNQLLESRNGNVKFRLKMSGKKKNYSFTSSFYLEDPSKTAVNGFLPENLTQKGRITSTALSNFLVEKSSRGTWKVFALRIEALSDSDSVSYRSFSNEFESIERIPMFELDDAVASKVFLVTPKYHEVAEGTNLVSFSSSSSTYAIVLTKALK